MTIMVIITGFERGKMMRMKIQSVFAPSIFAASSRSLGIVKKNCRNKNIVKAPPPNQFGMISGL